MLPLLAAGAIAAPIVGGIIGNIASKGDRNKAESAMKEAVQIIDSVGAPPDLSQRIILEKLQQVGVLTPEMEEEIGLQFSKVAQIQEDSSLKDAQKQALYALQQRGRTGLSFEDKTALNQIRREVAADEEAKRQQILQNMAARGMAGSGTELIAQLQASQAGSQRASELGEQLGAQASQKALQAIQSAGSLGGQIRQQDFDVNQAKAQAEDLINKFNTEQAINRQQRNVVSKNIASEKNLSEQQRVADINTQTENQERLRQEQAKRDYWADQLSLAKARSGTRTGEQQYYSDQAQQTKKTWSDVGGGVSQGLGALSGMKK